MRAFIICALAMPLSGCGPTVALVVSPTCLTTPRVEAEFEHTASIEMPKGGGFKATSTTKGKLKRRCYSNPRTYEEGVAKVLGGVGTAIGNSVPSNSTE